MISIKQASIGDLEDIVPLFDAYRVFYKQNSDPKAAKEFLFQRLDKKESVIFIAYSDEIAVGFTQLYPVYSSVSLNAMVILNDLYVKPETRNLGIATRLLDRAKDYAREKDLKGISLETARDNPAQKLYEREAWKKDEDFLHYFWQNSE